jgi:hypothetical protein
MSKPTECHPRHPATPPPPGPFVAGTCRSPRSTHASLHAGPHYRATNSVPNMRRRARAQPQKAQPRPARSLPTTPLPTLVFTTTSLYAGVPATARRTPNMERSARFGLAPPRKSRPWRASTKLSTSEYSAVRRSPGGDRRGGVAQCGVDRLRVGVSRAMSIARAADSRRKLERRGAAVQAATRRLRGSHARPHWAPHPRSCTSQACPCRRAT